MTIRQPGQPAKVTLEPGGTPLAFDYRDGEIQVTIPQFAIHEVVVVQNKADK